MAYQLIEDFAAGLDLRKSAITSKPGTLRQLTNGFVNAGGEIEKRETFALFGTLPADTHGLAFNGDNLVVFGTVDPGSLGALPAYVEYQQLVPDPATAETIDKILDVEWFATNHFVVARFTDGSVKGFYNGAEVTDANFAGTNVKAHSAKMYAVDGPNVRFSAVGSATDWGNGVGGSGHGIIDVTVEDTDGTDLVGMADYYGQLALFGRKSIQVWAMDPDPALNTRVQTLGNIGLVAPHAAARYGSGDVLFLSDTGIRSLRARNSSNAASLTDIGSPIDRLLATKRLSLTSAIRENIRAFVEPLSGRFWLVWQDEIFVLSHYPDTKITAWSKFQRTLDADAVCVANSRIAVRTGNDIQLYGALPGQGINPFLPDAPTGVKAYDSEACTVETPFLDVGSPGTKKSWTGIDLSVEGTWDVFVNPDYQSGGPWTKVASVGSASWQHGRIPLNMRSTHLGVRLVSTGGGANTLASLALHYTAGESG